jgi:ribosome-associated heat shock protein Hsp15
VSAADGGAARRAGAAPSSVRLDKWLQVARVFKTRTQATRACALGRVTVNGADCKPHRQLVAGDRVEVALGERRRILVVRELRDRPVPKAEAATLYEDLSPPPPPPDPAARALRAAPARRDAGAGRPTKRERRELDRWLDGIGED